MSDNKQAVKAKDLALDTAEDQRDLPESNSEFWEYRLINWKVDANGVLNVPLPSGRGDVGLRGMTGVEENLFARDNRENVIKPFFDLIDNCCTRPQNYKNMWMDDFMFVLFLIRMLSYGDSFKFQNKCSYCQTVYGWEEDLALRPIRYAKGRHAQMMGSTDDHDKCFPMVLPMSKAKLLVKLPVAYNQVWTQEYAKSEKKDRMRTEALKLCVQQFNGSDVVHGYDFERLPSYDLRQLEAEISKRRVGVEPDMEIACPNCRTRETIELPIGGADFLVSPEELKLRGDGRLTILWGSPL